MTKPMRLWVQVRCPPLAITRLIGRVTPGSAVATDEEGESMSGRSAVTPIMSDAATTWVRDRSPTPAPRGMVVTSDPAPSGGMLRVAVPNKAIPAATPETACECPIMTAFPPSGGRPRRWATVLGSWAHLRTRPAPAPVTTRTRSTPPHGQNNISNPALVTTRTRWPSGQAAFAGPPGPGPARRH